jgi:hypothetical protein
VERRRSYGEFALAQYCGSEVRRKVEERVPTVYAAEVEIRESDGGVEVRAGTSTERRTDDEECGAGYRNSHKETLGGTRECQWLERRYSAVKQRAEKANGEHKHTEFCGLHQIFPPVNPKGLC